MGRFDQYQAPRFFTEVNVPGYDVGKSVAKSRELKQKARRDAKQQAPSPPAEPGPVTFGSPVPTTDTNKDDACPTFKIDL